MKELHKDEYAAIGRSLGWAEHNAAERGRTAYIACFPHAVAEALVEPSNEEMAGPYSWHEGNKQHVRSMFATRLARLTAKPGTAVEAVGRLLADLGIGYKVDDISDETLQRIVAAVDEARKGAK